MAIDADRTPPSADMPLETDASAPHLDAEYQVPAPEGTALEATPTEATPPAASGPSAGMRLAFLAFAMVLIGGAIWVLMPPSEGGAGLAASSEAPGQNQGPPRAGAPVPPIEMTTVDGRTVKLSDLKGKRVVINFWATWCPPCRAELPDLARIYEEQKSQGVEVIAVDVQETEPQVSRYLREIGGLPFTVGLDLDGAISRRFGVGSLPTSFFVDDEGIIRVTFVGGMNGSTIERRLTQIIEEQEYAKSQAQK